MDAYVQPDRSDAAGLKLSASWVTSMCEVRSRLSSPAFRRSSCDSGG